MSTLEITNLHASVETDAEPLQILHGVSLSIPAGAIHALMGPNGSGKSTLMHAIMGRPGYQVTEGSVSLDGQDILSLPTFERARAGLFATFQYPVEVPGVPLGEILHAGGRARTQAEVAAQFEAVGLDASFESRGLNVGFSGGEMKRVETVQLMLADAKVAMLDEIDSGLDVDAVEVISQQIREAAAAGLGILVISHHRRLLDVLAPEAVHVIRHGRIAGSGDSTLIDAIERDGYDAVIARFESSSNDTA